MLVKPAHAQILDQIKGANPSKIKVGSDVATILSGDQSNLINIIFFIVGILFFANLLLAAWEYIQSYGDPGKIQVATQRLLNAIIGIVVVLGSYIVIRVLSNLIGLGNIV